MADKNIDDEIEEQTATALPKREAMSLIAPPPVSGLLKADPSDASATTGQGIDESNPESELDRALQ